MTQKGFIYILTNPSFPNYVKIGYANDVKRRVEQLNRTECTPYAFRVYAQYEVHHRLVDKKLHRLIDSLNGQLRSVDDVEGKERVREFFEMTPEEAYELLKCIATISGTLDRLTRTQPSGEALEEEKEAERVEKEAKVRKTQRAPFNFTKAGIPIGAELRFVDSHEITATVLDARHISYNGRKTSLSQSAQEIRRFSHPVQGTLYWTYNGECLCDIRARREKEGTYDVL